MEACQRCGVTPVIIGRPLKEEGLSLQDARVFLSKNVWIYAVSEDFSCGNRHGSREDADAGGKKALNEAELLIGAKRMTRSSAETRSDGSS